MKTYNTLKELKEAIDSGELILSEGERLLIDTNYARLFTLDSRAEYFYDYPPACLLDEALDLLGIPHDAA